MPQCRVSSTSCDRAHQPGKLPPCANSAFWHIAKGLLLPFVTPGRIRLCRSVPWHSSEIGGRMGRSTKAMVMRGLPIRSCRSLRTDRRRRVKTAEPSHPEALPRAYAAWRCRMLVGAIIATVVGLVLHGPTVEIRYDSGPDQPSHWLVFGLAALMAGALGPGLLGICLALGAVWRWRRLGRSSRLARAAWGLWVLGPLPILVLPLAHLFQLNLEDSLRTSAHQVRYLLTVTAPAFFALLPGICAQLWYLNAFSLSPRRPVTSRCWRRPRVWWPT